jgi:hypothetical protein
METVAILFRGVISIHELKIWQHFGYAEMGGFWWELARKARLLGRWWKSMIP